MTKKWTLRKTLDHFPQELESYPELIRNLLIARGIVTKAEAEIYLKPDYERDLLDPFLMKDMQKAIDRLLLAIERGEKIVIFGDYDADGIPGSAILAVFLSAINFTNYEVYIPDRHNEDYGLSEEKIKDFVASGVKLIITIDCGITDVEEIRLAQSNGIDVVITDHHLVPPELPPAYAIVDAKQEDDVYPYKFLAGAGVMFKFVCGLLKIKRFDLPLGWEKWLLDLVAIATVSDMVSLTGENRLLTYYGLKVLRQTKRLGLRTLLAKMKIRPANVVEDDISFMLGPRINSASRMSHASQAFYLLTTSDLAEAEAIATHLEEKNQERKEAVERIVKEITLKLDEHPSAGGLPALIVMGSPDWNLGVLGMTSSKIMEKYGRPVFLWSQNEAGVIKGSCRSDGSYNVVELMREAEKVAGAPYFQGFGGHPMAGGFSLEAGKEALLAEYLILASQNIPPLDVIKEHLIDADLDLGDLNWETYKLVEQFAPFGMDNPKPIFCLRGVEIDAVKYFGNGGLHLELSFKKPDGPGRTGKNISAIGFFALAPRSLGEVGSPTPDDPSHIFGNIKLEAGEKIDLLFNLEKSMFKNYPELRLRIVDLRKPE